MTTAYVARAQPLLLERILKAAQWHALMQSGEVRPEDEHAFHNWHLIAENAEVYQRIPVM
jgi:ferric-dicitrate binding protein FerR (iron transport regulator)